MPVGIDLNSITPDFRDFLLERNLILSQTIENSGYASLAGGSLGWPADIGTMDGVIDSQPLEDVAFEERTIDLSQNAFRSDTPNAQVIIGTTPVSTTFNDEYSMNLSSEVVDNTLSKISRETLNTLRGRNYYIDSDPQQVIIDYGTPSFTNQVDNYLDTAGRLNLDGPSTQAIDIAGGLLSGQSPLINNDGTLSSTSDVRTGLLGRTLNASGIIDDTPLGTIAGQELSRQLVNNLGRNAVQATVGRVNTSVTDLLRGGDIFVPDYKITNNPETTIADLTGFNLGRGLDKDLFFGGKPIGNIDRANNILEKTGKGQINVLFSNLRQNRFRAGYTDIEPGPFGYVYMEEGKISAEILDSGFAVINESFGDEAEISVSNPMSDKYLKDSGFENPDTLKINTNDTFTWDTDTDGNQDTALINRTQFSPDSLLDKTRRLFDSGFINTLDGRTERPDTTSEIQTGIKNGKISKGSAVIGEDGNFCRVWTKKDPYSTVGDLQKHEGIRLGNETQKGLSVLDDNGFVRMSPISGDNSLVKRYMFSIENLAWEKGSSLYDTLLPCEQGFNGGRIMWFPPYDLNFTDNSSAKWDSHEFIGRPEPMYTYNNSERSGNLSFKIIVDNPSAINAIRENAFSEGLNDTVDAYFAGCNDEIPDEFRNILTTKEQEDFKVAIATKPTTKAADPVAPFPKFSVYFLNDVHVYVSSYESGTTTPYNNGENYIPSAINGGDGSSSSDKDANPGGRNVKFNEILNGDEITDYFSKNGSAVKVEVSGYASSQGTSGRNQILSDKRAEEIKELISNKVGTTDFKFTKVVGNGSQGSGNPEQAGVSYTTNMKDARRVDVVITVDPTSDESLNSPDKPAATNTQAEQQTKDKVAKRMFTECSYFNKLEESTEFVGAVDKIYEKIKYFSPAFHSVTPEGFNSRLNFLLQCTKPGETAGTSKPTNLAFGKPPVCVLRLGDFYHTKIIIDSVNFSFDPLLWDLNPEGIGVQPMLVNVDLSFKFIGGSSLEGPIQQLQNAVSFNFFANTEIYDSRSTQSRSLSEQVDDLEEIVESPETSDSAKEVAKDRIDELNQEIARIDETKPEEGKISPDDLTISNIKVLPLINNDIEIGKTLEVTFVDRNGRDIVFDTTSETINYRLISQSTGESTIVDIGSKVFESKTGQKTIIHDFDLKYSTTITEAIINAGFINGGTVTKKI